MTKLLDRTMRQFVTYASIVLLISVPVYYFIISRLWDFELREHGIKITDAEGTEDSFIIIGAVTAVTVVFFLLLFAGFLWINRKISSKLWEPFHQSLKIIRSFNIDQRNTVEFDSSDIDEFNELNASLDKLITGSVEAYRQQKEFADNASHELQTPLAIVQSKLELLSQSSTLDERQYEIIEDTLKALSRVSRINKNLLLLTKIENKQFLYVEDIDVALLFHATLKSFESYLESKNLKLELNLVAAPKIKGNKILFELLLTNLMTNAIRYTNPNGIVKVLLKEESLTVSNSADRPLKEVSLFKRFSTGNIDSPGTGLGLAIVKEICNRHEWSVLYEFAGGMHNFKVYFAKAR